MLFAFTIKIYYCCNSQKGDNYMERNTEAMSKVETKNGKEG